MSGNRELAEAGTSIPWAVVTGGSSGIGLAAALMLVGRGFRVLSLDVQPPASASVGITFAACDVTYRADVEAVLAEHIGDAPVGALVNSAGVYRAGLFLDATDADFEVMFAVNVQGTFVVSQLVARLMTASGGGAIVNVSSVAASNSTEENPLYSATKGAVSALTRGMAVSLAEHGIRVNAVAPGPINTPMGNAAASDPVYRDRMLQRVASHRFAEIEDVAYAIEVLVDPRGSYITGHVLPVDGGVLAKR